MGIFDSILGGDKNISLGTTSSSGTSGGQNDTTTQPQSTEKKIVPVIEEMTLIDTSMGEESDLPKTADTVVTEPIPEVVSFNENQTIDIGGSANVITETTSIIGNNQTIDVIEDAHSGNNLNTSTPPSVDADNSTLFTGTSIDLMPEPEKILEPLPGQDAWSEESSIHIHGNTEKSTEEMQLNPQPAVEETEKIGAPDIFGGFNMEQNPEPVIIEKQSLGETSISSEPSTNLFGGFEQEEVPESEEIKGTNETISLELPVIETSVTNPQTIHTLPSIDYPVIEGINQDSLISNPLNFEQDKIEKSDDVGKLEGSLFGDIQEKGIPKIIESERIPEENPKDILKNTIEQLKELKTSKNQLLKETRKQADDYKESAKKMHDSEIKTRLLIKDIEAEIVRIGELIDVCYMQMKEGTEKKVIPPAQKRIKGKLVKTQNKNIKKATV